MGHKLAVVPFFVKMNMKNSVAVKDKKYKIFYDIKTMVAHTP